MRDPAADQQEEPQPSTTSRSFTNPVTDTTYRLRVEGSRWRITKSRADRGVVVLRHLRGESGGEIVPQEVVAQLVRGDRGIPITRGDPVVTFAAVVVWDLDCTYDVLVALAREAQQRFDRGAPGFRPRAPVLRAEAAAAMATAEAGCREMATAWKVSGLGGEEPDWMRAALDQ